MSKLTNFSRVFGYTLGFLSLVLVIDQLHEWMHVGTAWLICAQLGTKQLSGWALPARCQPAPMWEAFIWLSGPALNIIVLMGAFWMMNKNRGDAAISLGITCTFAALPLARIEAALRGGGDETFAMHILFDRPAGDQRHLASALGLALVVIFNAPPLVRAWSYFSGWRQKFILFPAFLILPVIVADGLLHPKMVKILSLGFLGRAATHQIPWLVFLWLLGWAIVLLIHFRNLQHLYAKGSLVFCNADGYPPRSRPIMRK